MKLELDPNHKSLYHQYDDHDHDNDDDTDDDDGDDDDNKDDDDSGNAHDNDLYLSLYNGPYVCLYPPMRLYVYVPICL